MLEEKTAAPLLKICLLGRLEYCRGDEILPPLATQKTQSLSAFLISHRHQSHSRQKLACLFWGDCDEVHAHHSLATALWRIRKLWGEDYLLCESDCIQFNPWAPFWLDVTEFESRLQQARLDDHNLTSCAIEHLEEAIKLYRGDFLEGFYDDWCLDERYRLEALYLNGLGQLINWHEQAGDTAAVLTYAQQYLARDPLMESIHLAAMRALMKKGNSLGARRQWQRCCEIRQQELHLPPSPEMLQQARRILGNLFTLPTNDDFLLAKEKPRPINPERSPFVGRTKEMTSLTMLWEQTMQGRGKTVFIRGESGVGKTRLTEELAALVRWSGGIPLHGNCYEPERGLPLQPIREILQSLFAKDITAFQEIGDWERREISRLLPEMSIRQAQSQPLNIQLHAEQQTILFQSMVSTLCHFARRMPLLLVFEDVHWAADTTLAALHFISRQIGSAPVLIAATFRPEEISSGCTLERMVCQLVRDEVACVLALEPLSKEAVFELIQRMEIRPQNPDWYERLYAHTEGNAFYTIETLRAIGEGSVPPDTLPVPKSVQDLIRSRLGKLSPSATQLITVAAVAGRSFDFDLIRLAVDVDENTALEKVEELLQKGFWREGSGAVKADYEFIHQIVQEVVYRDIHHRRRQHAHRRIGEVLENLFMEQTLNAGLLAFHFDCGGDLKKALSYHQLATERANAVFAWQEAEHHHRRILDILSSLNADLSQTAYRHLYAQVLAEQAKLHYLRGDLTKRDQDLQALKELTNLTQDHHLGLQALLAETCYLNLDACYPQAIDAAQRGIQLAEMLGDTAAQYYLISQLAFADYFLGQPQAALCALEAALDLIPDDDCESRRHILHILGYVHFHLGNYALGLEYQREAYRHHERLADFNGMAWAGLDIGANYLQLGDLHEAERTITEHLSLAQQMGARSAEAYGLTQLGTLALKQGNASMAVKTFQQALSLQEGLRTEHGRVAAQLGIGFAYYHLAAEAEARRYLEMAIGTARRIGHLRRLVEALIGMGLTALRSGAVSEAHSYLTEAVQIGRESRSLGNLAAGLAALARLYRKIGCFEMARTCALEAVQISRQLALVACEMWAEVELGLLCVAQESYETAYQHTQRAIQLSSKGDDGWIGRDQVHQAHALALRLLGHQEEAKRQEQLAEQIIAQKAAAITDPNLRTRYLEAVKSPL